MKNLFTRTQLNYLACTLILCGLASCTQVDIPATPKVAPDQWTHAITPEANAIKPDFYQWWATFSDPQLDKLVKLAIDQNLNINQARERIRRARIQLGHAGDEFLPELHAHTQPNEAISARDTYFQYGFDATWEISLFGRKENIKRLARASLDSSQAEAQATQVAVVAEVVRTYIELRTSQQQGLLLEQQSQLTQHRHHLMEIRQQKGLASTKELAATRNDTLTIQNNLLKTRQLTESAAQRLALLLGQTSVDQEWKATGAQPTLGAYEINQLPVDMVRTRPEIKLAEAAVLQATGELGVAKAEMYPYLALGSAYLYSANLTNNRYSLEDAIHSTPAIGPTIDIPLFDWGRRRAGAKAQDLALNTALTAYRQSVLEGVAEVETALSSLQTQQKILANTKASNDIQQKNLGYTQHLEKLGFASQLSIIEQQQQSIESGLGLLEAQASHNLAFVALYKSLGGAPIVQVEEKH